MDERVFAASRNACGAISNLFSTTRLCARAQIMDRLWWRPRLAVWWQWCVSLPLCRRYARLYTYMLNLLRLLMFYQGWLTVLHRIWSKCIHGQWHLTSYRPTATLGTCSWTLQRLRSCTWFGTAANLQSTLRTGDYQLSPVHTGDYSRRIQRL